MGLFFESIKEAGEGTFGKGPKRLVRTILIVVGLLAFVWRAPLDWFVNGVLQVYVADATREVAPMFHALQASIAHEVSRGR